MALMTLHGAVHVPVNTLALRRGGLVKAVMLRANALAQHGEQDVVVEVLSFQPRLREDVDRLVRDGFLDHRVHVRSVLAALDPALPPPPADDPVGGCVHHTGVGNATSAVGRPAIEPIDDPRAVALAEPPPGQRTKNDYGSRRRLLRQQHLRRADGTPVQHRWIGRDGYCYLTIWLDPATSEWLTSTLLADGELHSMSGMTALYRFAFERLLAPELHPVLFSEFREALPNVPEGFDQAVLAVAHPSVRRVAVLHSNHALLGQRTLPKRSGSRFTALLTDIGRWDRVVVATSRQRDDIAAQYGGADRIKVIPHYTSPPAPSGSDNYDADRFVLVTRLHPKKRVDEAVRAFRLVVDRRPEARLEVYGFGYGDAVERQIHQQVSALGLTPNVIFRGFVADVRDIYGGACATIQTSQSEGFGMALLESLAHGVPAVAYDVEYGAREVVRHGVDGFVVPWGDRDELARRTVQLAEDRELRARLAEAAPTGASRFSRERYTAEWSALLHELPRRPDARVVGGTLRVEGEEWDQLVVRARSGGSDVEIAVRKGVVALELPTAEPGTILDVYTRVGGQLRRLPSRAGVPSDDPRWRPFITEFGNLSLRRVPGIDRPHGRAATAPEFRRLRWIWPGLRARLKAIVRR
jgi:poly(glycerol-phosphate) alpha-glucosyltransferase